MDERGRILWVEGLIFLWEREGLVILCGRERGESVSRRHIILLPNGPAFSSAVWSPSSISSMPSLKIEVLCMLGCREASESGRHITLDGDEVFLGGVCVCVCVCQILRENKPKERNGYSRRDCAGLEVGRGRVRVSKCAR